MWRYTHRVNTGQGSVVCEYICSKDVSWMLFKVLCWCMISGTLTCDGSLWNSTSHPAVLDVPTVRRIVKFWCRCHMTCRWLWLMNRVGQSQGEDATLPLDDNNVAYAYECEQANDKRKYWNNINIYIGENSFFLHASNAHSVTCLIVQLFHNGRTVHEGYRPISKNGQIRGSYLIRESVKKEVTLLPSASKTWRCSCSTK